MVMIPKVNLLESLVEMGEVKSLPRPYLGYSSLGNPCNRALWYSLHWCNYNIHSKRIERLFERGEWEENRVVNDLKKAGMAINCFQGEIVGPAGHVRGHIDAIAHLVPGADKTIHLLEIKTANENRFKKYLKIPLDPNGHANTRLKEWEPKYYTQCNSYMGKLDLKRCLFIVTNKNTEERVYDRLHFDSLHYELTEEKVLHVLLSEDPPFKLNENPSWYECKYCNSKQVCHHSAEPLHNCRTCEYSCLADEGKWNCEYHSKELDIITQQEGCPDYKLMSNLK